MTRCDYNPNSHLTHGCVGYLDAVVLVCRDPSYRQFGRETTFSVDQLLIRNALLASAFEMRCVICC